MKFETDTLGFHGRRIGVEVKRMDALRLTPSMRVTLEAQALDQLTVIYPGNRRYLLSEQAEVVPAVSLSDAETFLHTSR